MMRVLVLDLGGTLTENGEQPFPRVPEALGALRQLRGSDGQPLELCLVSDFKMPDAKGTPSVRTIFREYLAILDRLGLQQFFVPAGRHVTLSTHAGVMKPDRRVYELALERLGTGAGLADCLSITEDGGHLAVCRTLGMEGLQFGVDFSDWSEAPLLVRHLVDPTDADNTAVALAVWFASNAAATFVALEGEPTAHRVRVRVRPVSADRPSRSTKARVVEVTFDDVGRVVGID